MIVGTKEQPAAGRFDERVRGVEACKERRGFPSRDATIEEIDLAAIARPLERRDDCPSVVIADLNAKDGFALSRLPKINLSALCGSPRR